MLSWIALNMVEGLKPVHKTALINAFGTPESVFRSTEMELSSLPEIRPELAYRVLHFDFGKAEQEQKQAARLGIHVLCLSDEHYPALLKNIADPPLVLYIHGSLLEQEATVALVGSRKPTPYGLNVAQTLASDLTKSGMTIVSGLARGIDARAHKAALDAGGRTIAVLGSGLDVIYPAEHKPLAGRIREAGAVISEFPLATPPDRENFPVRNRIISGLAYGVVVVEASNKSGSLITARLASEQGREVLAVPGSIFNDSSSGCHALIKDGAALVTGWKDIIEALPAEITNKLIAVNKDESTAEEELSDSEKTIVRLLSFEQPHHVDHLAAVSGMGSSELLTLLVSLELKHYITQMPGKHFLRVK